MFMAELANLYMFFDWLKLVQQNRLLVKFCFQFFCNRLSLLSATTGWTGTP